MQPHLSTLHPHLLLCVKEPNLRCYVFLGHIVVTDEMNLESAELPKSLLVQVMWEWLTIRQQTMLSPRPHTSVTSLCAETMQSGWRVLSLISCWKIFLKCCAGGGNNRLWRSCFPCKVQSSGFGEDCGRCVTSLFIDASTVLMCSTVQTHDPRPNTIIPRKNKGVKSYGMLFTCTILNIVVGYIVVEWKCIPAIQVRLVVHM